MPLNHLDLVAIRIGHEEEPHGEPSFGVKFLDWRGVEALRAAPPLRVLKIVDRDSKMTVSRTVGMA